MLSLEQIKNDNCTYIDGPAGTEVPDSSGEVLDIAGADISDYVAGKAILNFEHMGGGSDPKDTPSHVVGRVVYAKKISDAKDCENDRQLMYYNKVKAPMIYVICRLADGAGHKSAQELAALIRDQHAHSEDGPFGFSVEGSTLSRDGNTLKETVCRRLAVTSKPCNKSCMAGLLHDGNPPEGYEQPVDDKEKQDSLAALLEDAKKAEAMEIQRIGGGSMAKTLTAGNYNAAPGTLTGGAALQVEDLSHRRKLVEKYKNTLKAAIRDYDGSQPLKTFLKTRLPEADDSFIDHFADLAHDIEVKKRAGKLTAVIKNIYDTLADLKKTGTGQTRDDRPPMLPKPGNTAARAERDARHAAFQRQVYDAAQNKSFSQEQREINQVRMLPKRNIHHPPQKDQFGNTVQTETQGDYEPTKPQQMLMDVGYDQPIKYMASGQKDQMGLPLEDPHIRFNGMEVAPGEAEWIADGKHKGKKFHILHQDPTHLVVVDQGEGLGGEKRRWNRIHENHLFKINRLAAFKSNPKSTLTHATHGIQELNVTPEQQMLIDGTDLSWPEMGKAASGINANISSWRRMGNGQIAYVKKDPKREGFGHYSHMEDISEPRREVLYSNLARDFFGLGHAVPNAAAFVSPQNGEEYAAIPRFEGAEHYDYGNSHRDYLEQHGNTGELHKMALMNMLMHNHDRHSGNWMIHPTGVKLIDHGLAWKEAHGGVRNLPDYFSQYHNIAQPNKYWKTTPVPDNVIDWAMKLSPNKLRKMMAAQGAPARYINETADRVTRLRSLAEEARAEGKPLTMGEAFYEPQAPDWGNPSTEYGNRQFAPIKDEEEL